MSVTSHPLLILVALGLYVGSGLDRAHVHPGHCHGCQRRTSHQQQPTLPEYNQPGRFCIRIGNSFDFHSLGVLYVMSVTL